MPLVEGIAFCARQYRWTRTPSPRGGVPAKAMRRCKVKRLPQCSVCLVLLCREEAQQQKTGLKTHHHHAITINIFKSSNLYILVACVVVVFLPAERLPFATILSCLPRLFFAQSTVCLAGEIMFELEWQTPPVEGRLLIDGYG